MRPVPARPVPGAPRQGAVAVGPPPPSGTPAGADVAFRCFMQTSVFSRLRPTRLLLIKEQSSDVRGTRPDSAQTSRPAEGRRSRPAPSRRKCQGPTPDRRDQQSGAALAQPSRGGLPAAASRSRTRSLCVRRPGPGALSAACSSCLLGTVSPPLPGVAPCPREDVPQLGPRPPRTERLRVHAGLSAPAARSHVTVSRGHCPLHAGEEERTWGRTLT